MFRVVCLLILSGWVTTGQDVPPNPAPYYPVPNASVCRAMSPPQPVSDGSAAECGSSASWEEALDRAWEFAPRAIFHPLERWKPMDPRDFLRRARLFDALHNDLGAGDDEEALLRAAVESPRESYVTTQHSGLLGTQEFMRGSPLDETGRSSAPMFFTLHRGNETKEKVWRYTFILFFAWNGCSNQMIFEESASGETGTPTQQLLEYNACPLGAHEGDFEHVQVEVCADLSSVRLVTYSTHAYTEQLNCTMGQCPFVSGTNHPVAYVALNTHGMYSYTTDNSVYFQAKIPGIDNVKAASLVDRTRWSTNMFDPTPHNVHYAWSIAGPLNASVAYEVLLEMRRTYGTNWTNYTNSSLNPLHNYTGWGGDNGWFFNAWSLYAGRWGRTWFEPKTDLERVQCLLDGQTSYGNCPNNVLLQVAQGLSGILNNPAYAGVFGSVRELIKPFFSSWGPTSPFVASYNVIREPAFPSPVVASEEKLHCPDPSKYGTTVPLKRAERGSNVAIISIAVFCLIVLIVLVVVAWLGWQSMKQHSREERLARHHRYNADEKSWRDICQMMMESIPYVPVMGMMVSVIGLLIMWDGLREIIALMDQYIRDPLWSQVEDALSLVTPAMLIVYSVALVNGFWTSGRTFEYFFLHQHARLHNFCKNWGWSIQIVVILCLMCCSLLNVAMFGFGTLVYGITTALVHACDNTDQYAQEIGICLNLEDFGFDNVFCGADIVRFCNQWRVLRADRVAAGAMCSNLGGLLFILASGYHFIKLLHFTKFRIARSEDDKGNHVETVLPLSGPQRKVCCCCYASAEVDVGHAYSSSSPFSSDSPVLDDPMEEVIMDPSTIELEEVDGRHSRPSGQDDIERAESKIESDSRRPLDDSAVGMYNDGDSSIDGSQE